MKPLEQQTIGQRIIATAIIVLIILFILSFIGWISGGWDESRGQPLVLMLPPSPFDAKILELDRRALDEAYVNKLRHLYDVYVASGREAPERPMKGAAEARRAYIDIMKAIEAREQALKEREK